MPLHAFVFSILLLCRHRPPGRCVVDRVNRVNREWAVLRVYTGNEPYVPVDLPYKHLATVSSFLHVSVSSQRWIYLVIVACDTSAVTNELE